MPRLAAGLFGARDGDELDAEELLVHVEDLGDDVRDGEVLLEDVVVCAQESEVSRPKSARGRGSRA